MIAGSLRYCRRRALMAFGAITLALATRAASGQRTRPATPESKPASHPTTTQAAAQQRRQAAITAELAEKTRQQAEARLRRLEEEKRRTQQAWFDTQARRKLARLELQTAIERRRRVLAELRTRYAEALAREASLREQFAALDQQCDQIEAKIEQLSREQRSDEAARLEARARELRAKAGPLRQQAAAERERVSEYQQLQQRLVRQRDELRAAPPGKRDAELLAVLDEAVEQTERLIDSQRLVTYALDDQAARLEEMATRCEQTAAGLRAANRRFWVRHAYLINIARILAVTVVATIAINIVAAVIAAIAGRLARRSGSGRAVSGPKRVRTLVYFARSIAKLLLWVFAIVTILAEFGISPGQSAGALGVIGLVLAGMFQQLVVDFVKGIDIATGGHYFVGDFVEVGGRCGHVLDITAKYTILRAPSGQILHLPNSQCIPSRRFPAGFVDNYVDVPVPADADVHKASVALDDVGRLLNERIEAVRERPELVGEYRDEATVYLRARVRVLPASDWVIRDYYVPMIKRRFEREQIPLAGEPTFFFLNNVKVFRRLFNRQVRAQEIERLAREESRPTLEQPGAHRR